MAVEKKPRNISNWELKLSHVRNNEHPRLLDPPPQLFIFPLTKSPSFPASHRVGAVKSNKIFTTPADPVEKGSHIKVLFIFKSGKNKNYYGKWTFYLVVNYGVTSPYTL